MPSEAPPDLSPADVAAYGAENGWDAATTATALRNHRDNVATWLHDNHEASQSWQGVAQLDKDTREQLDGLRWQEGQRAVMAALPDEAERGQFVEQLQAGGYDPAAVDEQWHPVIDAYQKAVNDPAWSLSGNSAPKRFMVGDKVVADYFERPRSDGHSDFYVQPAGEQAKPLTVRIPSVTDDEVKAAIEKKQRELNEAADKWGIASEKLRKDEGSVAERDKWQDATKQARAELDALQHDGKQLLTDARLHEALKQDQYRGRVGDTNWTAEMWNRWQHMAHSIPAALARAGDNLSNSVEAMRNHGNFDDKPGAVSRWLADQTQAIDQTTAPNTRPDMEGGTVNNTMHFLTSAPAMAGQMIMNTAVPGFMATSIAGETALEAQKHIDEARAAGDEATARRIEQGRDLHALMTGVVASQIGRVSPFNVLQGVEALAGRGVLPALGRTALGGAEMKLLGMTQRGLVDPLIGDHPDVVGGLDEFVGGALMGAPFAVAGHFAAPAERGSEVGKSPLRPLTSAEHSELTSLSYSDNLQGKDFERFSQLSERNKANQGRIADLPPDSAIGSPESHGARLITPKPAATFDDPLDAHFATAMDTPPAPDSNGRVRMSAPKGTGKTDASQVRTGDVWSAVKGLFKGFRSEDKPVPVQGNNDQIVQQVHDMITKTPVVRDADGVPIRMDNPEAVGPGNMGVLRRVWHLLAGKGKDVIDRRRAGTALSVPTTISDYHVKLKMPGDATGYLRTYKDGTQHLVLTVEMPNRERVVVGQEVVTHGLESQYPLDPGLKSGIERATILKNRTASSALPAAGEGGVVPGAHGPGSTPTAATAATPASGVKGSIKPSSSNVKPPGRGVSAEEAGSAVRLLNDTSPGLAEGVRVVHNRDELNQADFHPDDWLGLPNAEGFFDPRTGTVTVFTDQVQVRDGETPRRAVARVVLHETLGHAGLEGLRQMRPKAAERWTRLVDELMKDDATRAQIEGIGKEDAYRHLDGDPHGLVEEWFARKVEGLSEAELRNLKPTSALGKLWQWFKDTLARVTGKFSREQWTTRELKEMMALSKQAMLEGGPQAEGSGRVRMSVIGDAWKSLTGSAKEQAEEFASKLHLPRWTDLARSVNGWVGRMQGSSVAIRRMMHEIETRVPDALRREGITNWIQAGGDDAVLAAREASSKGALKEGYKAARNLTAEEVALAQKVRGYYDAALVKAQAHGLVEDGLENYVNQVWKKPVSKSKADALAEFQGQLSRTFKFGKHRTFESFHAGEQAGFDPATKDVSKLLGLYLNELNKTIATREMIGNLTKGKASDGRPLAVPTGGVMQTEANAGESTLVLPGAKGTVKFNGDEHDTRDYRRIDNPALAKWKFVAPDTDGKPVMVLGELAVHPEAHKVIKNALGQSEIRRWMNERADSAAGHLARLGVRAVDALQSQVKASMMSLSPFHVVQEGTHAIGHKVNPFTNIPAVDANNPAHVDMMNHGLMLAGDRVSMSQFMDGVTPAGSWLERIPGIGKWQKAMSEWTFEHYIPGLKIKTYEGILRRNTARFEADIKAGKVSLDDVKYLSAKQTNAAYGHLNYKDMGRNPTFQHLLRLCLLAPDFLEARSKFTGQAIQGIGSKVGREQAFAMATLAVTFYVAARAMNAALNDGDTKNDLDHLFTVQAGNRVFSMRSVPEDIYRLVHDWKSFTAGRVSPLIGTGVLEGIFGVNRRGEKLDGGDVVQDMLANALPLSVRMVPGLRDLTRTQKNAPVNPWEQFMGALGLQIGRHSPITETQKLVHKFTDAMGIEDRGTYPVSRYQQLRYALEDQNWDKAKFELTGLLPPGANRERLKQSFHASLFRHWTKNAAMDAKWKASLDDEQKALLERAEQRRKDVWQRFEILMR